MPHIYGYTPLASRITRGRPAGGKNPRIPAEHKPEQLRDKKIIKSLGSLPIYRASCMALGPWPFEQLFYSFGPNEFLSIVSVLFT